jgi:major capsid protein gp7
MPMTLVEAAKLETRNLVRSGVIEQFARTSDILRVLPFQDIQGNALAYNREEVLPGVAFRGVNEGYPESVGVINPATETLYIAGGDLDVDRFIIQTMGAGVRSTHENMKIKALAQAWTTKFIKGDTTIQPREFDGLQARLTGYNLIPAGSTSGGDPLKLELLDEAIDRVTNPTHILMSRALRRKFKAARNTPSIAGSITLDKDDFGRPVDVYNGLPLLTSYGDAVSPDPLGFNEAAPGGGTTATSLYVLSMGTDAVSGIQNGGMDVRDLGELDTMPLWRTRVEWYSGLGIFNGAAAVRLWGISNAPIVA